ncbi:MAG: autorepressor SdpR family transcription factor [Erysipelotrichaceae bacterium]|nr:autorepressor SdpR family transcription factor [Erysipelotrichaceae bacterium]
MGFNETMKALSDPTRRAILNLLKDGTKAAGEIGAHFDMTGATISHHLSKLKDAGLVQEKKEKNFIYYTLNASVLDEVLLWINDLNNVKEEEDEKDK